MDDYWKKVFYPNERLIKILRKSMGAKAYLSPIFTHSHSPGRWFICSLLSTSSSQWCSTDVGSSVAGGFTWSCMQSPSVFVHRTTKRCWLEVLGAVLKPVTDISSPWLLLKWLPSSGWIVCIWTGSGLPLVCDRWLFIGQQWLDGKGTMSDYQQVVGPWSLLFAIHFASAIGRGECPVSHNMACRVATSGRLEGKWRLSSRCTLATCWQPVGAL